jgi:hypothetical protein
MECAADYIAQLLYKNREQLTKHTIIKSKSILVHSFDHATNKKRATYHK